MLAPTIVWLASGGFTHMLCTLASAVDYAEKTNRIVLPYTDNQSSLQVPFYTFFSLIDEGKSRKDLFVSPSSYTSYSSSFVPPHESLPNTLADYQLSNEKYDTPMNVPYHIINDIESVDDNVRYLDYQFSDKLFEVTWGHFSSYADLGLSRLLQTIQLHPRIQHYLHVWLSQTRKSFNGPYIAAHFRNTDYRSDIYKIADQIRATSQRLGIKNIYWSSDDSDSYLKISNLLDDCYLFRRKPRFNVSQIKGAVCLHNDGIPEGVLRSSHCCRTMLTIDFLCDLASMASSETVVYSSGTVHLLVETIREIGFAQANFLGLSIS
jgi:hypothetical protein